MERVEVNGNPGQGNSFTEATVEEGHIYPQVKEVIHNHYHGVQPSVLLQQPSTLHCQLFITHEAIGVSRLLRQAKKRIVLHAAFYPKYALGEQGDDIKKVMVENKEVRLKVIFTDLHAPWINEFAVLLRKKFAKDGKFEKEINDGKEYFSEMQTDPEINPDRVEICDTARLPLFPVILIDDTLIVGHYAHSQEIAPSGLWLTLQHPRIPEMYDQLLKGERPQNSPPEERAILRYLDELII